MTLIPLAPRATVPFFYKYTSLARPENLERLGIIIQEHELYLPNMDQQYDPEYSVLLTFSEEKAKRAAQEKVLQRLVIPAAEKEMREPIREPRSIQ